MRQATTLLVTASLLLLSAAALAPTANATCVAQIGSTGYGCVTRGGGCSVLVVPVQQGPYPAVAAGVACGSTSDLLCAVVVGGTIISEPLEAACVAVMPSNGCLAGAGATSDVVVYVVC